MAKNLPSRKQGNITENKKMEYEIYKQLLHRYEQDLKRPCKLNKIIDAYSAPTDFTASMEISKSCDLSPLAAATLWCIERRTNGWYLASLRRKCCIYSPYAL